MKTLILILSIPLLFFTASAQLPSSDHSTTLVKGVVIEHETGLVLADASITVKDEHNKLLSFIPRAGDRFSILLLRTREHVLHIQSPAHVDSMIYIHQSDPLVIDLGAVRLRKRMDQLKAVVVTPPLIIQLPGKTVFRASEDPDAQSSMTFDLFRKVQGITIDGSDQLRLHGQTNFRIFINGRPSNLFTRRPSDVLKQFPASLIKDIEVIAPPPAKYDAEGVGGIINLVMLRGKVKGTTGNVSLSFNYPFQAGQHVSLTGKYGKWGIQSMLSRSMGQNPVMPGATTMEDLENKVRILQTGSGGSRSLSQMGNLEISFEPNNYHLITVTMDANRGDNASNYAQRVNLSDLSFISRFSEYQTMAANNWDGMDLSVDYQHTSPVNTNRTLTMSLRQSRSADLTEDRYDENKLDGSDFFTSLSNSHNHYLERTAQVDYFSPFKKHSFEVGAKFIQRVNYGLAYYGFSKDFLLVDDLQQIGSGYSTLSLQFGSWRFRLGVRSEDSRVNVFFRSDSTSVARRYFNVLPNVGINTTVKKYGSLFLNYSQRIQRPGIHYLNPFVEYIDPYNVSYGNPRLSPSLFHTFYLGYSHSFGQSSINTNLNYQFSGNSIVGVNEWGQDTIKISTYGNLGIYRYAGWSVNAYLRLSEVAALSLGGYINYYKYSLTNPDHPLYYEGFTQTVTSGLSLRFKKGWSAAANYHYNGTQIQFQGKNKGYSFHSASINKNFNKPRLTLSGSFQNPFLKNRKNEYIVETDSFWQHSYHTIIMRRFSVSLTWNFGKLSSSVRKPGRTISNDDLMK